ncbi:MAG TPA: hypothetical protein VMO20_01360, partial [Candidatus Acidoferrum sp.]|nr:hypothetical protein [Candidatus Acidoferrum sp.]
MEFGPEDLLDLGLYYLPSLIVTIAISITIFWAVIFLKRPSSEFSNRLALAILSVLVVMFFWSVYVVSTSRLAGTLVMLDSESSDTAEHIYDTQFRTDVSTVDEAARLAVNGHQAGSVRFYASCLIADMLVTNDDVTVKEVLNRLDGSPVIETEFFGGNSLTEPFYIPGHEQPELTAR